MCSNKITAAQETEEFAISIKGIVVKSETTQIVVSIGNHDGNREVAQAEVINLLEQIRNHTPVTVIY